MLLLLRAYFMRLEILRRAALRRLRLFIATADDMLPCRFVA